MLKQRILSSLLILPLPILALYFGSPWFELFAAAVLTIMGWEWDKMLLGRFTVSGMLIAVTGVCSVFLLDLSFELALVLPAVMTVVLYIVGRRRGTERPKLFAFGMPYSVYPVLAVTYLLQSYGFLSTIWLFGVVWGMDSGAYVFGRMIGGPKLAPKISPKKTWAGLFGGMLTAAAWGGACALYEEPLTSYGIVMAASAIFGAVSQAGDLFESRIKRMLDIKDSSSLIPGHGGIFDRLDALLVAAPVVVLLMSFCPSLNFWG